MKKKSVEAMKEPKGHKMKSEGMKIKSHKSMGSKACKMGEPAKMGHKDSARGK